MWHPHTASPIIIRWGRNSTFSPEQFLEAFGEKLRRQREQRGITLEAISSSTKISTRMLRALEEEHFDQLPGGVFNKGFIRAYARQVGLDEEEAISDYLAALHASQLQPQKIVPDLRGGKPARQAPEQIHHLHEPALDDGAHDAAADEKDRPEADTNGIAAETDSAAERRHRVRRGVNRRNEDRRTEVPNKDGIEPWQIENRPAADLLRSAQKENEYRGEAGMRIFATGTFGEAHSRKSANGIPWGVLAALLVICAGLTFWGVRRHHRAVQRSDASSQAAASSPLSTPATDQLPFATSSSASRSQKAELGNPRTIKAGKMSATKPQTIATHKSPTALIPQSETAGTNSRTITSSVAAGSAVKPLSQSIAGIKLTPFTLLIRAEKTSWVSISADGKLVAEETLIAPAEKRVRASDQIVVKAGNAAGISFFLNAKEVPAQGKDGEVKTYVFDASGIKVSGSPRLPDLN
jgi:cytoskeletal protein RodZ